MNSFNPRFMGHMDSMPTVYSVLGDLLASGMNNNLFALEMSPVLTRMEYQLVRESCDLFGLPAGSGGVLLDGGSLANLQVLTVARNAALGAADGDLSRSSEQLVLLCSADAHVSLDKAAMILGIGRPQVHRVATDGDGRMDPEQLESAILRCRAKGQRPFAIVTTAGTTITGNVDPIESIDEVARRHGIWHHVDAIWGGGLVFADTPHRDLLRGIGDADSITFNPQKWMMIAKTCSFALFRRNEDLERYFRIEKSYVRPQDEVVDLSETGIVGTKRATCLKLFLSLLGLGISGYRRFVRHTLQLTDHFRLRASSRPYLELATRPQTAVVCMRGAPRGESGEATDRWNADLQSFLLEKKNTFFSLPTYRQTKWLRIILLNPYLTHDLVDEIFQAIDEYERQRSGSSGGCAYPLRLPP